MLSLPRLFGRGLIEAHAPSRKGAAVAALFPGSLAGASLKPASDGHEIYNPDALPRLFGRGLIEAFGPRRSLG